MKRLLVLLSLFFAIAVAADRFGPVVADLRPDLRATLDAELTGSFVFVCPPEQELCEFITSNPSDTNCDVGSPNQGWSFVEGTDATLCDNQQFNGHIPDEASRVDRAAGFWSHGNADIAELVWDWEFIATGAGSGTNRGMAILRSSFALLCEVQVTDLAVADPADIILVTTTGTVQLSNRVTLGADTEFSGKHLQFKLQYNAAAGTCEIWVDHIGAVPGTGAIANVSRATIASQFADVVMVRNFIGANLVIMRNLAACPDGCTF